MKICDKCGVANADDAAFCTGCGAVLLKSTDNSEINEEVNTNQPMQDNIKGTPSGQANFAQQNTAYAQQPQSPFVQPVYSQPAQPQMPYSPQYGYINENMLPPEYRTVSIGQYIGYTLLFSVPVIGFIMLLVTAFGSDKSISLKNFAKSYLVFYAIALILSFFISIVAVIFAHNMYYY